MHSNIENISNEDNRRLLMFKMLISSFVWLILLIVLIYISSARQTEAEVHVNGWEKFKIRRAALYVYPNDETSLTPTKENICSTERPLIIIIVCSGIKNFGLRKAIRETWGSAAKQFNITVLFLLGISEDNNENIIVSEESTQYKDIIIENFIDTYNNLTIKSIYMLKWMKNNCKQARFLMKADDDTYINMKNLFNFVSLIKEEELDELLVGRVQKYGAPYRFPNSKWYMPKYMYPFKKYPPSLHGVAYLMSSQVAARLYNQSFQNDFIYLEDIFITGICALQINITPKDDKLFHYYPDPVPMKLCGTHPSELIVLSHHTSIFYMYKFFNQMKDC